MFVRSEERLEALAEKKDARAQEAQAQEAQRVAPIAAPPVVRNDPPTAAAKTKKQEGLELVHSDQVRNLWGAASTSDLENFKTEG